MLERALARITYQIGWNHLSNHYLQQTYSSLAWIHSKLLGAYLVVLVAFSMEVSKRLSMLVATVLYEWY